MALSKNNVYKISKRGEFFELPVQATTKIYQGAFVCIDSSGYVTTASSSATKKFGGVAYAQSDNTTGSAGDLKVMVETGLIYIYPYSSAAQTHLRSKVYATADDTLTVTSGANVVEFGTIVKVDVGSAWYVDMLD